MTNQVKHQPATPLPWRAERVHPEFPEVAVSYVDSDGGEAATTYCDASRQNADYIAHAANAYLKLVEALQDVAIQKRMLARNALNKEVAAYAAQDCERAEALLRELGEDA